MLRAGFSKGSVRVYSKGWGIACAFLLAPPLWAASAGRAHKRHKGLNGVFRGVRRRKRGCRKPVAGKSREGPYDPTGKYRSSL
jgi:hypothetical protein